MLNSARSQDVKIHFIFSHRFPSVADLASSTLCSGEPQTPADMHQCKRSADLGSRDIALTCFLSHECTR